MCLSVCWSVCLSFVFLSLHNVSVFSGFSCLYVSSIILCYCFRTIGFTSVNVLLSNAASVRGIDVDNQYT